MVVEKFVPPLSTGMKVTVPPLSGLFWYVTFPVSLPGDDPQPTTAARARPNIRQTMRAGRGESRMEVTRGVELGENGGGHERPDPPKGNGPGPRWAGPVRGSAGSAKGRWFHRQRA